MKVKTAATMSILTLAILAISTALFIGWAEVNQQRETLVTVGFLLLMFLLFIALALMTETAESIRCWMVNFFFHKEGR